MQTTGLGGGGGRDDTSALSKDARQTRSACLIAPFIPLHALIKAREV